MFSPNRFLLPLVVAMGGCFHSEAPSMHVNETREPLRTAAGEALVVFVRPSGYAPGVGANILDEEGHFLGDSRASSQFSVAVRPGRHLFTVWAENTDVLVAELAAGRIYYVEVAPTIGAFSAQVHLRAIKPGQPNWPKLEEWLGKVRQLTADIAVGQSALDRRPADVTERLRRAREHAERYRGDELARHTLAPGDGQGG